MAKKKVQNDKPNSEIVERVIRLAIDGIPGLSNLPEREYLETVGEALEMILEGVQMRELEIKQGEKS